MNLIVPLLQSLVVGPPGVSPLKQVDLPVQNLHLLPGGVASQHVLRFENTFWYNIYIYNYFKYRTYSKEKNAAQLKNTFLEKNRPTKHEILINTHPTPHKKTQSSGMLSSGFWWREDGPF